MKGEAKQIGEWIVAAQQGDSQAMNRLLEYCRPRVWRYLRIQLGNEEDCEDLTQVVLIRVARALPRTVLEAPFEHWLRRIIINCLCTFCQQKANHSEMLFSDLPDPEWAVVLHQAQYEASLMERLGHRQVEARLHEIIAQVCTGHEQQVIQLCEQDEPMEAIAQTLGMNLNTARSHLRRGRAKVLAHIVQYEPELIGGVETIERAVDRLHCEGRPWEQLTAQELAALRQPGRNQLLLRRACLKIARFLAGCAAFCVRFAAMLMIEAASRQWVGGDFVA